MQAKRKANRGDRIWLFHWKRALLVVLNEEYEHLQPIVRLGAGFGIPEALDDLELLSWYLNPMSPARRHTGQCPAIPSTNCKKQLFVIASSTTVRGMSKLVIALISVVILFLCCDPSNGNTDAGVTSPADSGSNGTPNLNIDAGANDAGTEEPDAGSTMDAGTMDAGTPADAGMMIADLPSCTAANVTAAALWTDVIQPSCANGGCHANASTTKWQATSGAEFVTATVDKSSKQVPMMKLVEPYQVHSSYLMWKVMGQAGQLGGTAARMPKGAAALSDANTCQIINWINSGAQ